MKTKHAVQTLLFSVAALALSACSDQRQEPAPKTAVTDEVRNEADAQARFLKGIEWSSRPNARAILYPELLNANAIVGEINNDSTYRAKDLQWFALIDYEPGAYFRHPINYAFVSYEDAKISIVSRENFPTVNYQNAWPNATALLASPNTFYAKSWLSKTPVKDVEDIQPENWPPRMVADQCKNEKRAYAVLINTVEDLSTSPETRENLELMAASLKANDYSVRDFVFDPSTGETRPYLDLCAPKGNGIYQLLNFINSHLDYNDCCEELIVYITGETTIEKFEYKEVVTFDLPFAYSGANRSRSAERKFYPEDLASILDKLKTCHLNVIIDANNAQGFADELLRIPNTESVLSSCQNNEYTYSSGVETLGNGSFEDPYGRAQGERGSEFTSSVAKAFSDYAENRSENATPPHAADLIEEAFTAVKHYDMGYLGGKTTPNLQGRTQDSRCPCGLDKLLTLY